MLGQTKGLFILVSFLQMHPKLCLWNGYETFSPAHSPSCLWFKCVLHSHHNLFSSHKWSYIPQTLQFLNSCGLWSSLLEGMPRFNYMVMNHYFLVLIWYPSFTRLWRPWANCSPFTFSLAITISLAFILSCLSLSLLTSELFSLFIWELCCTERPCPHPVPHIMLTHHFLS